jgi:hypothetical protein
MLERVEVFGQLQWVQELQKGKETPQVSETPTVRYLLEDRKIQTAPK